MLSTYGRIICHEEICLADVHLGQISADYLEQFNRLMLGSVVTVFSRDTSLWIVCYWIKTKSHSNLYSDLFLVHRKFSIKRKDSFLFTSHAQKHI